MSRKWLVLMAIACGTFMATLDSSIVNIALRPVAKNLATDLTHIKWIVTVYFLIITCLLLPIGRLSDLFGRKRVFSTGFFIFIFGSALCGLAPTLTWLIVSRVLQGLGAAMLMANGPAIITSTFPATHRGTALGTLGMVVSAGLISGPAIGGILIQEMGWRSVFLINIPIGMLGMVLASAFIEDDDKEQDTRRRKELLAKFDWAGSILQSVIIICLILMFLPSELSLPKALVNVSEPLLALLVLILCVIFVRLESRAEAPVFDLDLIRDMTFWTGNLSAFLTFVAYSTIAVLMPYYLQEGLSLDTQRTGYLMTAIPITILVTAPISGKLSDVFGSKELCILGATIECVTLLMMGGLFGLGLHKDISQNVIVFILCAIGMSIGLFQSPNNNAIMGAVPTEKLGAASAFMATVRNLALGVGTGFATGVFSWKEAQNGDFIGAMRFTYLAAGVIAAGAVVSSLGKTRGPHWKKHGLEKKGT
ncbi:MAG: MFS transporter [Bacteriovoracia bacterium]